MIVIKIHNQPSVTPVITGGRVFRLNEDVTYSWDDGRKRLVVHAGKEFDGASVPRIFHFFIGPMDPRVIAAALAHDTIYENPSLKDGKKQVGAYFENDTQIDKTFTKREADDLFLAINVAAGMDRIRRTLVHWAVRWFGRGSF